MQSPNPDTHEQEVCEIDDLLTHGLSKKLTFKTEMEERFKNFHRRHVLKTIRQSIMLAVVAFSFIGLSCLLFIPSEAIWVWLFLYLSVALIGFMVFRIPFTKSMQKHHQSYVGLGLGIGTTLILAVGFTLKTELQTYINYTFIFLLMVIYTSTLLNLKTASMAGWGSGAFGLLFATIYSHPIQWPTFSYIYLITNIIGMGIGYQNERGLRQNFLHQTLLSIEKIQLKQMGERLIALSRQDGLTSIANRRHFEESYQIEWLRAYRHHQLLSLIFIDVDFYKRYNDAYGHQQGDQCLIALAQSIDDQASRPEDLVARYGGEEFIMLLPTTDEQGAVKIAERIQQAIRKLNIEHKASSISDIVTVSMGIASTVPKSEDTRATLIRRADAALYHAKSTGRNCWRIAPSLRMIDGAS